MAVTSMNTKGPKKKKQHYVPKFYLRGFCGSGDTVFALDKESGGIFTPSVGDFCAERYLYESLSNDPNWYKGKFVYPNYTEDGLCELESAFAPVLKRVAALCVPMTTRESSRLLWRMRLLAIPACSSPSGMSLCCRLRKKTSLRIATL